MSETGPPLVGEVTKRIFREPIIGNQVAKAHSVGVSSYGGERD